MTCTGPECNRPATVLGLCRTHYQQHRRGSTLQPIRQAATQPARHIAAAVFIARRGGGVTARLSIPEGCAADLAAIAAACRDLAAALDGAA